MKKFTREEKRVIDFLFNKLFSMDFKIRTIKLLTKQTTSTYLNMFRKEETKINEMFDCLFDYEDKIEGIKLCFESKGYKVETLEEIVKNKHILEEYLKEDS